MTDDELLEDILGAIDVIEDTAQSGRDAFIQSRMLQSAALYSFVVIGEAASRISDTLKLAHAQVAWRDAIRYRNFVAHAYMYVDAAYVWNVMQGSISTLKQQVRDILGK